MFVCVAVVCSQTEEGEGRRRTSWIILKKEKKEQWRGNEGGGRRVGAGLFGVGEMFCFVVHIDC